MKMPALQNSSKIMVITTENFFATCLLIKLWQPYVGSMRTRVGKMDKPIGHTCAMIAPLLIDFGAARQALAFDTPMLKPMYTFWLASPRHYSQREFLSPGVIRHQRLRTPVSASSPRSADNRLPGKGQTGSSADARWAGEYSNQRKTM